MLIGISTSQPNDTWFVSLKGLTRSEATKFESLCQLALIVMGKNLWWATFFLLRFVHVKLLLSEFSVCSWLVCITHYTGLMSFASTLKSKPICNPFPWAQWYMKDVSLLFFKSIFLNFHKFFFFWYCILFDSKLW